MRSDLVLLGSYVAEPQADRLHIDLRLLDVPRNETLLAVSETGSEGDLVKLAARAGARLRDCLGLGPVPAAEAGSGRGTSPADPEAARLYVEGQARSLRWDFVGARPLLEQAAAREPDNPLIQEALASIWHGLAGLVVRRLGEPFRLALRQRS